MSDEIPTDLIALKREFYAVEADLAALSATMPGATAIIAGDTTEDPADRARWNVLYDRLGELAVQINRHPALATLPAPERLTLDSAASKAARQAG